MSFVVLVLLLALAFASGGFVVIGVVRLLTDGPDLWWGVLALLGLVGGIAAFALQPDLHGPLHALTDFFRDLATAVAIVAGITLALRAVRR